MNPLNSGTRLGTMLMDHFIMTFLILFLVAPGMIYDVIQIIQTHKTPSTLFFGNLYVNIFAFSLYFNKDALLGRSVGKRILKLQVVNIESGEPAGPLKCLLRNITMPFWPIEIIAALINNERRIGDYIAGTKLTSYAPDQHKGTIDWAMVIISILLTMLALYFTIAYPMLRLMEGFRNA